MTFFIIAMIVWFGIDILLGLSVLLDPVNPDSKKYATFRSFYVIVEMVILMWALTLFRSL